MKARNLKKILPFIVSSTIGLSGCMADEYQENSENNINYIDEVEIDNNTALSNIELPEEEFNLNYEKDVIISTTGEVNLRSNPDINSDVVDVLPMDYILDVNQKLDNNWYEINYNGNVAYVSGDYVDEEIKYIVKNKTLKVAYLKSDATIVDDLDIIVGVAPKYESVIVYKEDETRYYGVIGDYIGYVDKAKTEELTGTYVVVDISSQMLKLYQDEECIFVTPVITGKVQNGVSKTPIGIYEVFDTRGHRDLIGPDYRAYVDYMMKFNGGIGLHDAEYHTDYDENGNIIAQHGWKNKSDFGGHTYIKHGSHGCVNMMNDAAEFVNERVEIGTKVLVKK